MEDLMSKLKGMPGMGGAKVFGKDDIAKMAEMYKENDL